jgi:hypothetical protein
VSGPLSPKEAQRLRALASKVLDHGRSATAGPWFVVGPPWNRGAPYIHAGTEDPHAGNLICDAFDRDDDSRDHIDDAANFALIALYRSAAPALAAALLRALPELPPAPALEKDRGLKYHVERVDGQPLKGGCVVLEFGDERAAPALRLWADSMAREGLFQLAAEVRARIGSREPVR